MVGVAARPLSIHGEPEDFHGGVPSGQIGRKYRFELSGSPGRQHPAAQLEYRHPMPPVAGRVGKTREGPFDRA